MVGKPGFNKATLNRHSTNLKFSVLAFNLGVEYLYKFSRADLDHLTVDELLAPAKIVSRPDADLVKAALYLRLGYLEECHKITQQVATPTGSYWHGIRHRHEGDISNSKYWYARVGPHPVLDAISGYPQDAATEVWEFELLLKHTVQAATK